MTPELLRATVDVVLDLLRAHDPIDVDSVERAFARHRLTVRTVDEAEKEDRTADDAFASGIDTLVEEAREAATPMREGADPPEQAVTIERLELIAGGMLEGGD